jgi:hypothetical protein
MKTIRHGMILVLGLFIILAGVGFNAGDAGAAVLEKDANPVKMIFTSWGGVCMEREGQEKYFKVWKKDANTFEKLPIAKTNIQSFDVYDNLLVYLVNNNNMSYVNTYNLSTGQAAQLSVKFSNKRSVKNNGQYIVWEDFGLGKADLAIYNIAQGLPPWLKATMRTACSRPYHSVMWPISTAATVPPMSLCMICRQDRKTRSEPE